MLERKRAIFTIPEAAARLFIDRSYLYKLIRQGKIRAVRDDRGRLAIPESELVRLSQDRGYMLKLDPIGNPGWFAAEPSGYSVLQTSEQVSMPPGGSYAIDESALSEKARTLYTVLLTVSGLAPNMLRNIITKYERMSDLYDNNPGFLYNDLVNAGVPWYKAMNILTQFYHLVNPSALQSFFPFPSNSNLPTPFMPPFMPGAKIEDEEEKEERKAQKRMERMISYALMVMAMKSLGGAPSQPSFMQFPPIPGAVYRPVLDKDGKPLRDEMGNLIYAMSFMQPGDIEQ